jgi:signal transduction histidine kinase
MTMSTLSDASHEVMARLHQLEDGLSRLREGPDRAALLDALAALRDSLGQRREAEQERRHRIAHDLRVPLNAIAGWTHILKMDAGNPSTVARAADVLQRNVQALTRLIEASAAEGPS